VNETFKELERKASLPKLKEDFINLIKSVNRPGINELLEYIESTDFFTAPASTRFHSNFEGGLLIHSMNVYNRLKYRLENDELYKNLNYCQDTVKLTALLHDLCKANVYKIEYRKQKVNDIWTDMPVYVMEDNFPLGHGEKSVFLIEKYVDLTEEEALAIRYHMGAFMDGEANNASKAFNLSPLALVLHIADSEATSILEKEEV
jgi:HD superfamily phosphohydrolase YqeK